MPDKYDALVDSILSSKSETDGGDDENYDALVAELLGNHSASDNDPAGDDENYDALVSELLGERGGARNTPTTEPPPFSYQPSWPAGSYPESGESVDPPPVRPRVTFSESPLDRMETLTEQRARESVDRRWMAQEELRNRSQLRAARTEIEHSPPELMPDGTERAPARMGVNTILQEPDPGNVEILRAMREDWFQRVELRRQQEELEIQKKKGGTYDYGPGGMEMRAAPPKTSTSLWDQLAAGVRYRAQLYPYAAWRKISGVDELIDAAVETETEFRIEHGIYSQNQRSHRRYLEDDVRRELLAGEPMVSPDGAEKQGYVIATLSALDPEIVPEAKGIYQKMARFGGELAPFIAELAVTKKAIRPLTRPITNRMVRPKPTTPGLAARGGGTAAGSVDMAELRAGLRAGHAAEDLAAVGTIAAAQGEDPLLAAGMFGPIAATGLAATPAGRYAAQTAVFSGLAATHGDKDDVLIEGFFGPLVFSSKYVAAWAARRYRAAGLREAMPEGSPVRRAMDRWEEMGREGKSGSDPEVTAMARYIHDIAMDVYDPATSKKYNYAERKAVKSWLEDHRIERVYDLDTETLTEHVTKPGEKAPWKTGDVIDVEATAVPGAKERPRPPESTIPTQAAKGKPAPSVKQDPAAPRKPGPKVSPSYMTPQEAAMEAQRPVGGPGATKPPSTPLKPPGPSAQGDAAPATTPTQTPTGKPVTVESGAMQFGPTDDPAHGETVRKIPVGKLIRETANFEGMIPENAADFVEEVENLFRELGAQPDRHNLAHLNRGELTAMKSIAERYKMRRTRGSLLGRISDELSYRGGTSQGQASPPTAPSTEGAATGREEAAIKPGSPEAAGLQNARQSVNAAWIDDQLALNKLVTVDVDSTTGEQTPIVAFPNTPDGVERATLFVVENNERRADGKQYRLLRPGDSGAVAPNSLPETPPAPEEPGIIEEGEPHVETPVQEPEGSEGGSGKRPDGVGQRDAPEDTPDGGVGEGGVGLQRPTVPSMAQGGASGSVRGEEGGGRPLPGSVPGPGTGASGTGPIVGGGGSVSGGAGAGPEQLPVQLPGPPGGGAGGGVRGPGHERGGTGGRIRGGAEPAASERRKPAGGEPAGDEPRPGASGTSDYIIPVESAAELFGGSKRQRIIRNIEAIKVLQSLAAEHRPATAGEKRILAGFTGWGALSEVFEVRWKYEELNDLKDELSALLEGSPASAEGSPGSSWAEARRSTTNAFYTPPEIIRGVYDVLNQMGFRSGKVLEPSMGVGHFYGFMPPALMARTQRFGVERDAISGAVAAAIYSNSKIFVKGFEQAPLPGGYFDVAVGNVPFGNIPVVDHRYPREVTRRVHDYFFMRTVDLLRPGGVLAFITSHGTMDKVDSSMRRRLHRDAAFLGAIRFNRESLPGTKVIADLIFLQKRRSGAAVAVEHEWLESPALESLGPSKATGRPYYVNEYFQTHPEMVIGRHAAPPSGGLRGGFEYTVEPGEASADAFAQAIELLSERLAGSYLAQVGPQQPTTIPEADFIPSPDDLPGGALFQKGGRIYASGGTGKTAEIADVKILKSKGSGPALRKVRSVLEIRDTLLLLYRASRERDNDAELLRLQKQLNEVYDGFARRERTSHAGQQVPGSLHHRSILTLFEDDPYTLPIVQAIEDYDQTTKIASKGPVFKRRVVPLKPEERVATDPADALAITIDERGWPDIERVAEILGSPPAETLRAMIERGLVFESPSGEPVTSDEYLSGNVRQKLRDAEAAAEHEPERFAPNVEALRAIQPEDFPPSRIFPKLGAPWILPATMGEFAEHLLGQARTVTYAAGKWAVGREAGHRVSFGTTVAGSRRWGTENYDAGKILEDGLNLRHPVVKVGSGDDRVVDAQQTIEAKGKLEEIQEEFTRWLWSDATRSEFYARKFNDEHNNTVKRHWRAPKQMSLPGLSSDITPFSYQMDGAYRGIHGTEPLLLDTGVGGGKTLTMAMIAEGVMRLGIARKVFLAVQNSTLSQIVSNIRGYYPGMPVTGLTSRDVKAENIQRSMARIAAAERGLFVVPHSVLPAIPLGEATLTEWYTRELDQMRSHLALLHETRGTKASIKQMETRIETLSVRLRQKIDAVRRSKVLTWEEIGADWLMYDESQGIKNLQYSTTMVDVAGMGNPGGSARALDAFIKGGYVLKQQGGRGVLWATGTPLSNSMSELYTLFRNLAPRKFELLGMNHFDDFARMFVLPTEKFEPAPAGGGYKKRTRLTDWVNVNPLLTMYHDIAHRTPAEEVARVRRERGAAQEVPLVARNSDGDREYEVVALPENEVHAMFIAEAAFRTRAVRGSPPEEGADNVMVIIKDEQLAAIDVRLLDSPKRRFVSDAIKAKARGFVDPAGKLSTLAKMIVERWRRDGSVTLERGGDRHEGGLVQAVFINLGTPAQGTPAQGTNALDVYGVLINDLVAAGIPRDQIATIYDADHANPERANDLKQKLFARVNSGQVRVFMGSIEKMGVGVNIQRLLRTSYQLDPTYRPSDLTQMDGRSIRGGNLNAEVEMFRFVTENSSDEFMYSLISKKARSFNNFLNAELGEVDEFTDTDDEARAFEMAMAKASGNPLMLELNSAEETLRNLRVREAAHRRGQDDVRLRASENLRKQSVNQKLIALWQAIDTQIYAPAKGVTPRTCVVDGATFTEPGKAGAAIIAKVGSGHGTFNVGTPYVSVGTINGVPFSGRAFEYHEVGGGGGDKVQIQLTPDQRTIHRITEAAGLHEAMGEVAEIVLRDRSVSPQSAAALANKVFALLDQPLVEIDRASRNLTFLEKEGAAAKELLETPFTRDKELAAAKLAVADIQEKLAALAAPAVGGGGEPSDMPPGFVEAHRPERMQQRNLTADQHAWLREHGPDKPAFGMGGLFSVPDLRGVWQRHWDDIAERLQNLPPGLGKRVMDAVGTGVWGGRWGLEEDTWRAFERVKGTSGLARDTAARISEAFDDRVKALTSAFGGTPEVRASANRDLEDAIRGKLDPARLDPAIRRVYEAYVTEVNALTDELLAKPHLHPYMQAFGLSNIVEMIALRRTKPGAYLRRLYEHFEQMRGYRTPEGNMVRNIGPRIRGGMFKHKRSDDELWTVQVAPGRFKQFADRNDAQALWEELIKANEKKYGESVYDRFKIIDPLGEDATEHLPQVTDVRVLMAESLVQLASNMQTLELFYAIANTVAKTGEDMVGLLGDEAEGLDEAEAAPEADDPDMLAMTAAEMVDAVGGDLRRAMGARLRERAESLGYVPLSDTITLGPLAGMFVPKPVADNIMEVARVKSGVLHELYAGYMYAFKSSKVLYNLPTWMRNAEGMLFLWALDGLSTTKWLPAAASHMRERSSQWKSLVKEHELLVSWQREDLQTLEEMLAGNKTLAALTKFGAHLVAANRKIGDWYNFLDEASKMASYLRNTTPVSGGGRGMSHDEALQHLWMYTNYGRLGGWAAKLKREWYGAPFVSFTDNLIKINLRASRNRPGRLFALWALPGLLSMAARIILGIDDEEEELLNQSLNRIGRGVTGPWNAAIDRYFQPIVPWRDRHGRLQTLDLRWTFPLANDFRVQTGPGGIGIPFVFAMPHVSAALELRYNVDEWTGKPIYADWKTDGENLAGILAHVWRSTVPLPTILTSGVERLYKSATGQSGQPLVSVVVKELLGISIRSPRITREDAFKLAKKKYGEAGVRAMEATLRYYNDKYRAGWDKKIRAGGVVSGALRSARNTERRERRRGTDAGRPAWMD
jgi:N12 class adenine-specific DNA methylase